MFQLFLDDLAQVNIFLIYCSVVDLHCCASLKFTAKRFNCTHTHTYSFVNILFHYRLLQNIEYIFISYKVGPCWLYILYIVVYFMHVFILFYFLNFILISIQLIFSVVSISVVQHSDPVIHTYIHVYIYIYIYIHSFSNIMFHHVLSQETAYNSLCCTV